MTKRLSFEDACNKISNKLTYLKLLEFNGYKKIAKFLDKEYGEFSGIYVKVLYEKKRHRDRALFNLKNPNITIPYNKRNYGKKQSIKQANKTINYKYPYLTVIEYNGSNKNATFLDSSYGEFIGNYSTVLKGKHKHKERSKHNRKQSFKKKYGVSNPFELDSVKEKIKETNLKKYGVTNPQQNKDIKEKTKRTNLKKYMAEYPSQNKIVLEKIKNTFIKNKVWNHIDGYSLTEFYDKNHFTVTYNTFRKNFYKYKELSINSMFYNILYGKSNAANQWLDFIEEQIGRPLIREPEYHIPKTLYHADGYDPITNTIYEFYGDYWHGYPFKNLGINKTNNNSFNTLYYRTMDRENKIKELGYNMVSIWEHDFKASNK